MSELSFIARSLERLWHRMRHVVRYGRVTATNDKGTVTILQVQMSSAEVRDNTPYLASYGFTHNPLPGADVAVIFSGGDLANGVAIATNDQRYRPKDLTPGEVCMYDNQGRKVYFTKDGGIVVEGKDSNVTVKTTQTVVVHGDVSIELSATNGETLRRLVTEQMVQLFNSHTHGAGPVPNQTMGPAHLTGVTKAGGP